MGDIEYGEPIPGYIQHLFKSVDAESIRNAGFRVLIDYDYSDASAVLPTILNELGVTTIPLNAGMREGEHHRTVPDETALISKTVRADVGCMISPTGERITIIDDNGVVLSPHECLAVLASWWVRSNPGIVLAPAATPMWISDLVRKEGGSFSATPGDPASVLRASSMSGTSIASDGEGGFAWPGHLGAFDAMYTLVKLLELRAKIGIPLSQARAALPQVAYVTATEFCPWEAKGRVMRILLDRHRTDSVDLVDGIKVYVDDGFVLVRPDPDEPAYHVVASVADPERGRQLVDEYLAQVREAEGTNGVHAAVEAAAGAE
jgi:mannose-1-phosphate guanylyltransferase/phosphomannomutase